MIWSSLFMGGLLATSQTPVLEKVPVAPTSVSVVQAPAKPADKPADAPKAEAKEEEEAPKFLLMRIAEGTHFGGFLDDHGIVVKGRMDGSFTASTAKSSNLPMAMNYLPNQFQLEQNTLIIDKAVDTKAAESTWGFRLESILGGTDYRFSLSNNLAFNQLKQNDGGPNTYGVDPIQFYVEHYNPNFMNGLDTKVGRFYTILNSESLDPTQNKLVSRSLTFMNNPFTHTGVLTGTNLNDKWVFYNGVTGGADVFFGPAAQAAYLGGLQGTLNDGKTVVNFNTQLTNPNFNQYLGTVNNYDVLEARLAHKINDKWDFLSCNMFSWIDNWDTNSSYPIFEKDGVTTRTFQGYANWFGFCNYLTYTFSEKAYTTSRVEFFVDSQGVRTGYTGLYTTLTQGLTYKMCEDQVWVRPEFRYDYAQGRAYQDGSGNPTHGLFTFALDFVVQY